MQVGPLFSERDQNLQERKTPPGPIPSGARVMAYTPLTFHPHCGKNVRVTEGGRKVEKITVTLFYGAALTARPLMTEEVFTLQLIGRPELNFGVTTRSPETINNFPMDMYKLPGTWCLQCESVGFISVHGKVVDKKFLSVATLDALTEGTLGLKVTKDRKLSFYLNGKSVGVAATDIPSKVYAFVDLPSLFGSQSVKLIPDIRETRPHAATGREVRNQRQELQQREREDHRHQQLLERQQEGLLELLQESEREKDGLRQQLQQTEREQQQLRLQLQDGNRDLLQLREQVESLRNSHQRELQQVRTELQAESQQLRAANTVISQLRQQLAQTPTASQLVHHMVPRGDITLNMQRILGTGGWGYVVEGKFRGQTVAVKCLHDLIREPAFIAVIRREIGIMVQVRHPNLVLLIAAVIDEEDPLIITELLDLSLRRAYERNQLDPGERCKLSIFRDIASALNYLHLHHHGPIIHRDVSSTNVLLESRPNGQWRAKLSDFGSAKLAREATTTGPGAAVYSAPEVRGNTGIRQSPKVDVYSYGVLLCEVGVGQFPLEGRFPAMMQSLSQRGPLLHRLVSSCTQEHPDDRPTMATILADLDRALGTEANR